MHSNKNNITKICIPTKIALQKYAFQQKQLVKIAGKWLLPEEVVLIF